MLSKRDASDYGSMKPATVSADKLDFTIPAMRLRRQAAIWQRRQYEHDITQVNPNTGKSEHVRYEYRYSRSGRTGSATPATTSKKVMTTHRPDLFNLLPGEVKVGAYKVPTELLDRLGGYFPWHPPSGKPARAGTCHGLPALFLH